jgi:hypothetical protein
MTAPDHRRRRPRDRGFGVLRGTACSVNGEPKKLVA